MLQGLETKKTHYSNQDTIETTYTPKAQSIIALLLAIALHLKS